MIYDIQTEKEFDEKIGNAKGWVLLDFFAVWCRPCKMMTSVLAAADEALGEKVTFYRIDLGAMEDFAEQFHLVGVPTFILFNDGQEKGRIIGYHDSNTFLVKLKSLMEKE